MEFDHGAGRVWVNITDHADLMGEVGARLRAQRGFALATLNLDHLVKLRYDSEFAKAYGAQDLVTADGNPVVWLSRLAGREVALLPGADLVEPLAAQAARCGVAVAFVGGTEDSLARAARALQDRVPGLRVAARIAPPMGFDPS
ncbi:WecB/TagA/CpsF family glycosyltransferase, partial [Limimaricola sp. ASW11-118]